ncbi:Dehydrogenase reductase SDR member 4, partial [Linnemannia zychae]
MTPIRRVAVVTGSSRGIGRAIALRLARDGYNIVINYQSNAVKAQEAVDLIISTTASLPTPVHAIAVQANIAKLDEGQKLLDATIEAFGRLDVVVFNAALVRIESILNMTEQSYLEAFDTNTKGPIFFSKIAQPYLAKAQKTPLTEIQGDNRTNSRSIGGGSRIINITATLTSMSLVQGDHFLYCATKGALEQVTRALAKDKSFGGMGITVNAIAPGAVDTDTLRQELRGEGLIEKYRNMHPEGRIGEPEDIADVVAFLASEES